MPDINKTSVREELDRLQTDFQKQSDAGKISEESRLLIQSLFTLLNLIVAIFLEKTTTKTNKNSSKPSSQTDKDDTALSSPGSKKKGKIEKNEAACNRRTTETVSIAEVNACTTCGEDLSHQESEALERRTRIDIRFEKIIAHVDAEIKSCGVCQRKTKGIFPTDMQGALQYGNGLKAYAINLIVCQMVALNRVQKCLKAMIGQTISEASLLKFVWRLHQALEAWEKAAIDELLKTQAIHVDETSMRVDKKNHWIHVYSSGDITLKKLHQKRGKKAIEDINIIPRYGGTIIHDCWASYLSYMHCGHGLCGSHLLRELTFIIDSNGYLWAIKIKKLLQEACKKVTKSKRKRLTKNAYKKLQQQYINSCISSRVI